MLFIGTVTLKVLLSRRLFEVYFPVVVIVCEFGWCTKLNVNRNLLYFSDKKSGVLVLVCELMDMNIYELIRGKNKSQIRFSRCEAAEIRTRLSSINELFHIGVTVCMLFEFFAPMISSETGSLFHLHFCSQMTAMFVF